MITSFPADFTGPDNELGGVPYAALSAAADAESRSRRGLPLRLQDRKALLNLRRLEANPPSFIGRRSPG